MLFLILLWGLSHVSTEVENHTHTTEEQGYPVDVDVNEIAEEVLELLIEKLKG